MSSGVGGGRFIAASCYHGACRTSLPEPTMSAITLDLPDDLADRLRAVADRERAAREESNGRTLAGRGRRVAAVPVRRASGSARQGKGGAEAQGSMTYVSASLRRL